MLRSKSENCTATANRIDLSDVVEMGQGSKAVLFLHGLFGTPGHWTDVMETLSERYRVYAPQMPIDPEPGRRQNGMQTIADLSATVMQLIDDLELDSFVLCGNSLGGLVAIDICLTKPGLANGLVLAGSAGLFERSPIRGLKPRPSRRFVETTIAGILHDESLMTDDLVDQWHAAISDRDYVRFLLRVSKATRDRCVEDELSSLELPTMIIWGSNDEITPPDTGREFQRLISGSKLEFIENCGHAPNWERPRAFGKLLDGFLPTCFG